MLLGDGIFGGILISIGLIGFGSVILFVGSVSLMVIVL